MITISALGAILGLLIAIVLIVKKFNPAYSLILGSMIGAIIGGANIKDATNLMILGAKGMMPAVLRIITAGILVGVLIESGAAKKIAESVTEKLGKKHIITALVLSTCLLTMVGVFIDVAVITVSPIALSVAKKSKISRSSVLLAMIGGGKAGNLMSPNPNAIAVSEAFNLHLTSTMLVGVVPAIFGIIFTIFLAKLLRNKGSEVEDAELKIEDDKNNPSFLASVVAPLVAIFLLTLRPLFKISVDPLIALPLGAFVGCLFMGKLKKFNDYAIYGLSKMTTVAILLIGTGTLAGIISNSNLKDILISAMTNTGMPAFLLAPLSGILMSGATASTTSGSTVASQVFAPTLNALSINPLASAGMIHAGATVLDHLPHGSFFHATGGSLSMNLKERLALIPYESLVGLIMVIVSTIFFKIMVIA